MNKILIDTMYIEEILTRAEPPYSTFADAIDDGKIIGISSVVSITELVKVLGKKDITRMQSTIHDLKSSEIILIDVTQPVAERAGNLRLKYNIPTVDSLIAATGLTEGTKHVLTRDNRHFEHVKNLIKPIALKTALKLASK